MTDDVSEEALILAPLGRDAEVAARMLGEAGLASRICIDLATFGRELNVGAGFAVLTEEALAGGDMRDVSAWIADQPEWSDFPFVLLTHRGGGLEHTRPRRATCARSATLPLSNGRSTYHAGQPGGGRASRPPPTI